MKPVLSAAEMRAVDERALEHTSIETLIDRAGFVIAKHATGMLGGAYGRRVIAVVGKGHNGDDGRVASRLLSRRGAKVLVVDVADAPLELDACDLVIDAAFGTGFRGEYVAPLPTAGTPVLAVDIASGLSADTGTAGKDAVRADRTVTMGALKPGLLLGEGPDRSGEVVVEQIGLPIGDAGQHLVEDDDLAAWLAPRSREAHKWNAAVFVLAGSPGMRGASYLSCAGALRAGSGMVRLGSPGASFSPGAPESVVEVDLSSGSLTETVRREAVRARCLVIGPGLGRADHLERDVLEILSHTEQPVVLDADGLNALGSPEAAASLLQARPGPTVLTPHDGEFERLSGQKPGPDRVRACVALARATNATVLLKGPTTIVSSPDGEVLFVHAGTPGLATAGTGDVLSGVIGAFIARGLSPLHAAGLGAHVHGRASRRGLGEGMTASDLPLLIAEEIAALRREPGN